MHPVCFNGADNIIETVKENIVTFVLGQRKSLVDKKKRKAHLTVGPEKGQKAFYLNSLKLASGSPWYKDKIFISSIVALIRLKMLFVAQRGRK